MVKNAYSSLRYFCKRLTFGLQRKMFLMSGITGILLLLALVFAASNLMYRFMMDEYKINLKNQTQQISNLLDSSVNKMINFTMTIALDENVSKLMSGNYDEFGKYSLYTYTYKLISQLVAPSAFSDIDLYEEHSFNILSTDPRCITSDYNKLDLSGLRWHQKLVKSELNLNILDDYVPPGTKDEECFAVALRYQPFYSKKEQGIIIYRMNKLFFTDMLQDTSYINEDFIVITGKDNALIYSSNKERADSIDPAQYAQESLIDGIITTTDANGQAMQYRLDYVTSKLTGWKIISFYNQNRLQGNVFRLNAIIVMITTICIGILMTLLYFISRNFTRPISKLAGLMKEAEDKGYTLISETDRNDETRTLSECFNNMMKSIRENQILRREAEMDALQQQINPHFFYNTLEAINALAAIHQIREITDITEKMGSMFHYNVARQSQKFVTIGEELAHVMNYITIQKVRFGERLSLEVNAPDEVTGYSILKFTLQPLVENAVLHGIEKLQDNGLISINIRLDRNEIRIGIFDNCGMPKEQLEATWRLLENPPENSRSSSIGLRNVNERLKLCYGTVYGITIASEEGTGTTVTVTIPV